MFWIISLVLMVLFGWGLDISPQSIKLYQNFPCYRAHVIYYSAGQYQDEDGNWTINEWKWPDYQYVEGLCSDYEHPTCGMEEEE